jgi:hypothetical protein
MLRSASEPSIQNKISSAAYGLGAKLRASEVSAAVNALIAMPASTIVKKSARRPASE